MDVDDWLEHALADADARGLPDLRPLLDSLARATRALRAADWNRSPLDAGGAEPDEQDPAGAVP